MSAVPVQNALIDPAITRNLGAAGVEQLLASLWPVDCQTCGNALGAGPVAVYVVDLGTHAGASLHHPSCQPSSWNDSGLLNGLGGGRNLSWTATAVGLPIAPTGGHPAETKPALVVNPGLEQVMLDRTPLGRWQLGGPNQHLVSAGLTPPGSAFIVDRPIPGAVASVGARELAVTFTKPPTTYSAVVTTEFRQLVTEQGGVIVVVTHSMNPGDADNDTLGQEVVKTLSDPVRTRLGFVELDERRRARPAPPRASTGRVFQLHWKGDHLAVGPVLAHTPDPHDDPAAQAWAEQAIATQRPRRGAGAAGGASLIGWTAFSDGTGWYTIDALTVEQFALRRYPDGWRLTKMLSRADGKIAQTENEARAWANRVLETRENLQAPAWRPGPTAAGAITLYAEG